ncbi:MAG TPA: hypothetical protein VGJ25_10075 [Gaiellaceae bacterium]|jgi:hypothetical protein
MSDVDTTHECPAPGCAERVPFERFACPAHWFSIPKPLRDELWHAWRFGTVADHLRARAACVAYLAQP